MSAPASRDELKHDAITRVGEEGLFETPDGFRPGRVDDDDRVTVSLRVLLDVLDERDQALAMVDWLTGGNDDLDDEDRPIEDVVVADGVL